MRAIVNWYGITDIKKIAEYLREFRIKENYAGAWISDLSKIDSTSNLYSPVKHITSDLPPIITIHAEVDSAVKYDQEEELHKLLSEEGVKNELFIDPDGNHGGFSEKK